MYVSNKIQPFLTDRLTSSASKPILEQIHIYSIIVSSADNSALSAACNVTRAPMIKQHT